MEIRVYALGQRPATRQEDRTVNATIGSPARGTLRGKPDLPAIGLLAVTMVIGYEWFVSGLVKFVRGDFPGGLADELREKSEGTAEWYASFLDSAVIPNAKLFAYLTQTGELLAGVALLAGSLIWLFAWDLVSDRIRMAVLLLIAVTAIGATFLAINLYLANNGSHPWLIPGDAFEEGIDLDSVLPAIQIAIATVSIILFRRLWRARVDGAPSTPSASTSPR
jgi:uncharacterized membrane protein YphA (DoxX/SURF4 family)